MKLRLGKKLEAKKQKKAAEAGFEDPETGVGVGVGVGVGIGIGVGGGGGI